LETWIFDIVINTIKEFDDATFFEDIFSCKNIIVPTDTLMFSQDIERKWKEPTVKIRRSVRQKTEKKFSDDFVTYNIEKNPLIFGVAMTSSDAPFWKEAVNSEINSITTLRTWV